MRRNLPELRCATRYGVSDAERVVMKPRISLITLCVNDLEKSLAFYRDGLGLQTPGIVGTVAGKRFMEK